MKKLLILITIVIMLSFASTVYAQGCSDAGFCTLNPLKPNENNGDSNLKNHIKIGLSYGLADFDVNVISTYLEYSRKFSDQFSLDIKANFNSLSDGEVSSSGISDLYLNGTFRVSESISLIGGVKIPFGDGNKMDNKLSLPMDFQPSLGTLDLILGAAFQSNKFHFVLAMQQPISDNKNAFLVDYFLEGSKFSEFYSTNKYKRKGDLLFRTTYAFQLSKKISITPGILAIYHLADDEYTDLVGDVKEIDGSGGLTLNANMFLTYALNEGNMIEFSIGTPLKTRTARPDGLTRSLVISVSYRLLF